MLAGNDIAIPGDLVWAAIIYALIGTGITIWIGRPLVGLNFIQQHREADFRFSLVRVRENAESIAMYKGESHEGNHLTALFAKVVTNFRAIMGLNARVVGFTAFWSQFAVVFPLLIVAPRFFGGQILFGGLMQIRSAFSEVFDALSFIMDSFRTMATWKAVIDRLTTFEASLEAAQALPRLRPQPVNRGLVLENLSVSKPNGEVLLDQLNLQLQPGDTLLVRGASGSGKSTLLRALAGIWPYASGRLGLQDKPQVLYLSQKPYMPLGTLRSALYYPQPAQQDDAKIAELLALAGLSHLLPRLDETDAWSHVLSLGEQQRIALLRVLLLKPDFLFMDESTSALDVAGEARLYAAVVECMKDGVLVSVGHRVGLVEYHKQVLECQGQGAWSLAALQ
jgi:putative ATP-binding cassette transporter